MSFAPGLPHSQIEAIEGTVRAASSISIAASIFVIGSYLGSDLFQTPINRLIFYATWGNILANVGTMIARGGIEDSSSLCLFQAFFLQWFFGSDAFWIFCMAFNVYMTLFHQYTSRDLKKLEWRYFLFCYGVPFVPALVFLILTSEGTAKIYGSSTMWCWIVSEWDGFRMGFFYGPIWFLILLTFSIHLYAAKEITASRRRVKQASAGQFEETEETPAAENPLDRTPVAVHGFAEGNERARQSPEEVSPTASVSSADLQETAQPESDAHPRPPSNVTDPATLGRRTSIEWHTSGNARARQAPEVSPIISPVAFADRQETVQLEPDANPRPPSNATDPATLGRRTSIEWHTAGNARARQSPEEVSPTSSPVVFETVQLEPDAHPRPPSDFTDPASLDRRASIERHTAAYQYSKRAILFFVSLLITWTPSSAHRIYLIVHPERPHFALAYISGLVLSLQGFWNFVIYVATSFDAVKALWVISISAIRRRIWAQSANERRHSWEAILLRARRKKYEMSPAPPQEDVELARRGDGTTPAEGDPSSQDTHDSTDTWGMKWLGRRWWGRMSVGSTERDSSRGSWARRWSRRDTAPSAPVAATGAGANTGPVGLRHVESA